MLQSFLLITTICTIIYLLQPINGFVYSFQEAINTISHWNGIEEDYANNNVNGQNYNTTDWLCDEQFQMFANGVKDREEWAVLMFDAWGKLPSGMAYGNTISYGNYDQCMSIRQPYESDAEPRVVTGQSCLMPIIENSRADLFGDIDIYTSMKRLLAFHDRYLQKRMDGKNQDVPPFVAAVCVPAACHPQRVPGLVNDIIKQYNFSVPEIVADKLCQTNERPALNARDWTGVVIFTLFGVLLVVSTVYDVTTMELKKTPSKILSSFSVYSNGSRLFSCQTVKSPNILNCLNGIRVLSIVWIVFLHTNFMMMSQPAINSVSRLDWAQSWFAMFYHSGDIAVDTFLVIGGLLVALQFFKEREQRKELNLLKSYLHRYFRLTTVPAAAILFIVTLLKYTGNGPAWMTSIATWTELCEKNWWSTLLHVQNYVNPNAMCLGHTWYLAVDMQLYILSPVLLYPIWRWGRKCSAIIVVLIISSMACTFIIVYQQEFKMSFFESDILTHLKYERLVYLPTHTRMGPYLVGLLLGCVCNTYKGRTISIRKTYVAAAWLCSVTVILAVTFGPHTVHRPHLNETLLQSAFQHAFSRTAWALAISWLIFACTHGYGGAINRLLSHPMWQPLAKLSFCIYVLHLPIQIVLSASEKQSIYLSNTQMAHKFWGDFGFALMLAIVWSLAFEMPVPIIENYVQTMNIWRRNKGISMTSPKCSVNDVNANCVDNHCVAVEVDKAE